jgi:hypothetical protein
MYRVTKLLVLLVCSAFVSCTDFSIAPNSPRSVQQSEPSQVDSLIQSLRSDDINEREDAKKLILDLSAKSPEVRQKVIGALLGIVRSSNDRAQLAKCPECPREWKGAVDILGALQATEAIDALLEGLDRDDGVSGLGPSRYPATLAIIKIGQPAIPKLSEH